MSSFAGYDLTTTEGLSAALGAIFQDPTLLPESFTTWLQNWTQNYMGTNVSIDQITGYSQNTTNSNQVQAEESTTSITYTNLTTPGPSISAVSDGLYAVTYGCAASISNSATRARINISVNGAAPDDTKTPQAYTANGSVVGISAAGQVRLSGGSGNSITLQYAVGSTGSGKTATFGNRYLTATRVSN